MFPAVISTLDSVTIARRLVENYILSIKAQKVLKRVKAASEDVPSDLVRLVEQKAAACDEEYRLAMKYTPFLNFILPKACELIGVKDIPDVTVECFHHVSELGFKGKEGEADSLALSKDAFIGGMTDGETNDIIINVACCSPWFKQIVTKNKIGGEKQMFGVPQLVYTLCHELRHVAQYQLGMLKSLGDDGAHLWCGKKFPPTLTQAQYEAVPWEVDADDKSNSVTPLLLRSL